MKKIELVSEVCGFFTISTDKRGKLAEFPNLITNAGLDRMGANEDWLDWCQVGSGSTPPAFTNTGLVSRIASSSTISAQTGGAVSSAPYYCFSRRVFSFAQGTAAGNISEVGIGWLNNQGLYSRALVLDGSGNPTAITVLPDEVLQVAYELRFYSKAADETGTIVFTGNVGGTYEWTIRASQVTTSSIGSGWYLPIAQNYTNENSALRNAFNNGISGVTSQPTGPTALMAMANAPYASGSLYAETTLSLGQGQGNFEGGIGSIGWKQGIGQYQIGFNPKIPKTANETFSITLRHSWGRR